MPHPTIDILPRISVLQLVLSNLWHLFVAVVDGPVAKSSAFMMENLGKKVLGFVFVGLLQLLFWKIAT